MVHLAACLASDRVEVVAVADSDPARLAAAGAPASVARHPGAEAMLAAGGVDILCVLTPPATHEALVCLGAASGVHVLCEKPLALGVAAAERMIAACETAGVRLHYGASYRFLPALVAARALIAEGAVGAVRLLREQVVGGAGAAAQTALPSSHYPAGGPGGSPMGLMDHGVHLADLFAWLTGSAVVEAAGAGNRTGSPLAPEHLTLRLADGAVGSLLYDEGTFFTDLPGEGLFSWGAAWSAGGYSPGGGWDAHPGCVHIHGSHGALRAFHYANALVLFDVDGARQIPLPGRPAPGHFTTQIETFADEISGGLAPSCPPQAGVAALRTVLAAYGEAGGVAPIGG
ncbi:MAG: Gfo/Idh/MocA family oxidoreductase [Proteobacteria bacterium]|nr:Gfo/Idh/MocA family oxidoreductase [Pseudomonadota bacterium]